MVYGDEPIVLSRGLLNDAAYYLPSILAMRQSGNLYVYCGNDPVAYIDPDGNAFMLLTGAILAVVGGIGGALYSHNKYGEIRWQTVIAGAATGGTLGMAGGAIGAYFVAGSTAASTGAVLSGMGTAGNAAVTGLGYKTVEQGVNFTRTTIDRMNNPDRAVPVQILIQAIQHGVSGPDPQGTNAVMYTIEMARNGKMYSLEVLYDSSTNTILHFLYK